MKLPWKCPACGTVHVHPTDGCRHCNRPTEEPDPIFSLGSRPIEGTKLTMRVAKCRTPQEGCDVLFFTHSRGFQTVEEK
jgi:biotin synthase-related radical SAM superfamily protein